MEFVLILVGFIITVVIGLTVGLSRGGHLTGKPFVLQLLTAGSLLLVAVFPPIIIVTVILCLLLLVWPTSKMNSNLTLSAIMTDPEEIRQHNLKVEKSNKRVKYLVWIISIFSALVLLLNIVKYSDGKIVMDISLENGYFVFLLIIVIVVSLFSLFAIVLKNELKK